VRAFSYVTFIQISAVTILTELMTRDLQTLAQLTSQTKFKLDISSSSSSPVTSQVSIDLFQPRLLVTSKFSQVTFVHSVYNSALFLPSCCCSFLLHVVVNLIYLLSFSLTGSTFSCSKIYLFLLWSKTMYPAVLKNLISIYVNRFLSFSLTVQISLPFKVMHHIN